MIVEDGTGRPDAQSYVTVTAADAYHTSRATTDWSRADGPAKRAALIKATWFIDGKYGRRFSGIKRTPTQALEWPRAGAVDVYGYLRTGVPWEVKHATCELARRALSADLMPDADRGGRVRRVRVGEIETEYESGAPGGRQYEAADAVLSPLLGRHGPNNVSVGRV